MQLHQPPAGIDENAPHCRTTLRCDLQGQGNSFHLRRVKDYAGDSHIPLAKSHPAQGSSIAQDASSLEDLQQWQSLRSAQPGWPGCLQKPPHSIGPSHRMQAVVTLGAEVIDLCDDDQVADHGSKNLWSTNPTQAEGQFPVGLAASEAFLRLFDSQAMPPPTDVPSSCLGSRQPKERRPKRKADSSGNNNTQKRRRVNPINVSVGDENNAVVARVVRPASEISELANRRTAEHEVSSQSRLRWTRPGSAKSGIAGRDSDMRPLHTGLFRGRRPLGRQPLAPLVNGVQRSGSADVQVEALAMKAPVHHTTEGDIIRHALYRLLPQDMDQEAAGFTKFAHHTKQLMRSVLEEQRDLRMKPPTRIRGRETVNQEDDVGFPLLHPWEDEFGVVAGPGH